MTSTTTPGRLQDKVAIVTGGSSGIGSRFQNWSKQAVILTREPQGQEICCAYSKEGALVVVADLKDDATTSARLDALGGPDRHFFFQVDVAKADQVDALVRAAVSRWARLDVMCNNAGTVVSNSTPVWDVDDDGWAHVINVNLNGVMYGVRAASRQMLLQPANSRGDRGWIINTASVLGLAAAKNGGAYVTTKHAVLGLTKTAALDCAPHGIHVNALCPGFIRSPMFTTHIDEQVAKHLDSLHPLKGVGDPADVAGAAVFLASDDARWVTGHGLVADGGYLIQ